MKKFLFILAAMLIASAAVAENEVGIYVVENTTPESAEEDACYSGAPGQFVIYCVLTEPYNVNTGTPISFVGGFEFRINWPAGIFVTPTIHPSATNFQTAPDFFCGANIPVVADQATLITITVGTFTADPGLWFVTPISDENAQSIPGAIAITDANDNFSISQAFPVSGSFADPVFGMWTCVVPNEDVSFGGVKALFQ
jgi:hypothetical protein